MDFVLYWKACGCCKFSSSHGYATRQHERYYATRQHERYRALLDPPRVGDSAYRAGCLILHPYADASSQVFDDAYKSPLSVIVIDNIERLLGMLLGLITRCARAPLLM